MKEETNTLSRVKLLQAYQVTHSDFTLVPQSTIVELSAQLLDGSSVNDIEVSPCWIWENQMDARGYGRIKVEVESGKYKTRWIATHRLSYLLVHKKIPEGHRIIHTCGCASCCNPNHLVAIPLWGTNVHEII